MDLMEKLTILADSAKYDAACTSSGADRTGKTVPSGCCHSFSADGRCISLLKVLMTNSCIYDCKYCVNRSSNDCRRTAFTPEELAELTIEFYRRNYIEGLFLSSGVIRSPDYTMEQMIQVLQNNANQKRTYGPYDHEWHQLSASIRQGQVCHRCGIETQLCVHHIIPISVNGTREQPNLVTLCSSCHRIVEHESRKVQALTKDWEITQLLIRERLMCIV